MVELPPEISVLEQENQALRKRIARLEQEIAFLRGHPTLARGMAGETLVATLTAGLLTKPTASADVETPSGAILEVKYSALNKPHPAATTLRWVWQRPFGMFGAKKYDFLILIGEKDTRWSDSYKNRSSPYVMFCVPYSDVARITVASDGQATRAIFLTTNPAKARSSKASALFRDYEVTEDELVTRFGIDAQPGQGI
ncbi:hypothetical protein [Rhodovastum atsumiense]|uniref:Uncharacterized protein n=1 Tax=Rhodovastum atsumiense TaxID=504468 RepID=A0A5M6IQ90_9PROT|nr:hypothetical protein [Rhodovastum atsumiense]KAA5610442.1 hypothetical protein F1189_18985 [Rhodovastum atsumiense]